MNFPESVYYNKKIPKQKFYDKAELSSSIKKLFVDEIEEIRWVYKFSSSTINTATGSKVKE